MLAYRDLNKIASSAGDSFYLADLGLFEANVRRLMNAFRKEYPRTDLAYSYKTNYLPAFIRRAMRLGSYSEVVSRFEYDYARLLGVPASRIIVNGPIKSAQDLRVMIMEGARIHIDSLLEIESLVRMEKDLPIPAKLGIRCNLTENTPGSRFGLDLHSAEAREALKAIDAAENLEVMALHCHHSANRDPWVYQERAKALIDLHKTLLGGRPLRYIDMGGGFASAVDPSLAAQLGGDIPEYEDYAAMIGRVFANAYGNCGPNLIIEPGMAVLSDAMVFVARIQVLKRINDENYAVLDGSVFNVKPLRHRLNLPIEIVQSPDSQCDQGPWDLVGHTCMERIVDLMHTGCQTSLAVGDFAVFKNIGAYSTVLNAPFIRGTPPIIELKGGVPGRVLRKASTPYDLMASYKEP